MQRLGRETVHSSEWKRETALEQAKRKIKLYNEKEIFYKIGITTKKINSRFSDLSKKYNFKVIAKKETTLENAVNEEKQFLINFNEYKYIPKQKFDGHTECFREEIYNIMFQS